MKRRATLFLILLSCSFSFAQNFEEISITQNLETPNMTQTVDLDGDGFEDFIVAGIEQLLWYQGLGNGQFTKHSLIDSIQGFYRFSIFDWENDGDLDIFFTTYYGRQRAAWIENDSLQNFTYHLITDTITNPFEIKPFDIDKDNDVDILLSSKDTDELYWLNNDGFQNYSVDTIGRYVHDFEIADLDGDNDWDIIFGRAYTGTTISSVRVHENDGNNNFSMRTLKSGFKLIHEIVIEDINGDGFFDILVPDYAGDLVAWLKNDGLYGFSTQNNLITGFDGPLGISLKDINEDGKLDVLCGSYTDQDIYYFQGKGTSSTFSFNAGSLVYSDLTAISDLATGNFDLKNHLDFVHIDKGIDGLSVWTNDGSQNFTQEQLSFSFDTPRFFDMNDLDGDGDQDLATVSNDGDMVAWMENLGDDIFKTHILLTNYEEPYSVKINDLDDDGDNDIIAASDFDDRITWWENDGNGNFTMAHISTSLNAPRDFWIEDFDGDGDKDIAVICYWLYTQSGNTGAQLLTNDGSENFALSEIDEDIRSGRSMRGADMNGDTLIDVVISSYYYTQSKLRIAVNNGNGFTISTIGSLRCEDFELVDFDGDSDMDILAIDANLDSLYYYENTGNLQFTRTTLTHINDLYGISPRDYDGDGDIDVFFSTGYSGYTNGLGFEWGIFRNDGTGKLTTELWYQNLSMTKPMESFDYENDGDHDVIIGFDYEDKIVLYKNLDVNCHLKVNLTTSYNTSLCKGDSLVLTANSSDSGISFQWFRGSDTLYGDTAAQLIVDTAGSYYVEISDTSCTTASNPIMVTSGTSVHLLNYSICENDSLIYDQQVMKDTGTYTFVFTSSAGCDSTINIHVSVDSIYQNLLQQSICSGDSFFFDGTYRSTSGIYVDSLKSKTACDSIITLQLTVLPSYQLNQTFTICSGDSILLPGNTWQKASGIYIDKLLTKAGCDSIWTTEIIMNTRHLTTQISSICEGDSSLINGVYRKVSGTYSDTLFSIHQCDSIHSVSLSIRPRLYGQSSTTICQGDSIFVGGAFQKTGGIYSDTLIGNNFCDSIVSTTLNILPNVQQTAYHDICEGDSIFLQNQWQHIAGSYFDTLVAQNQCDSILTSVLTIRKKISQSQHISICSGDSLFLEGAWRKTAGNYEDIYMASNGCDSTLNTVLSITPAQYFSQTFPICQGDSVMVNGTWMNQSGTYVDTLVSALKCDSILTTTILTLAVHQTSSTSNMCEGDSMFIGGGWQHSAGAFVDRYTSKEQCDSLHTTHINVIKLDTMVIRNGTALLANITGASYQWLECDNGYAIIPGETSRQFVATTNGSYAVQVTQNGCVDTSSCHAIQDIGLAENGNEQSLLVYPNPSAGEVELRGQINSTGHKVFISVVSLNGSMIKKAEAALVQGSFKTKLDLSELSSGSYLIKVQTEEQEYVESIIIQK